MPSLYWYSHEFFTFWNPHFKNPLGTLQMLLEWLLTSLYSFPSLCFTLYNNGLFKILFHLVIFYHPLSPFNYLKTHSRILYRIHDRTNCGCTLSRDLAISPFSSWIISIRILFIFLASTFTVVLMFQVLA